MRKIIFLIISSLLLLSCYGKKKEVVKENELNTISNKVSVYTTAENTDLKISLTDNLTFKKATQPLETEVAVIVNPEKKFQTFLGIGGAITDAAAEVFSSLTPDKQEELLNATDMEPVAGLPQDVDIFERHMHGAGRLSTDEEDDDDEEPMSMADDEDGAVGTINVEFDVTNGRDNTHERGLLNKILFIVNLTL